MRVYRIVLPFCVATLTACASQPPQPYGGSGCKIASAGEDIVVGNYEHNLPKPNFRAMGNEDYYPLRAKRERLQGRVLASFKIDSAGRTTSTELLRIDAPPMIADAACTLLHRAKFDVSKPGVDTGGSGTYLTTVRFCLNNCDQIALFPDTHDITITAAMVRR
jgi:TonB family protein